MELKEDRTGYLAQMTPESVNAEAGEVTDAVQTGALVEAGIRKAVVCVDETVPALEAAGALALVAAVGVDASGPVPVVKVELL